MGKYLKYLLLILYTCTVRYTTKGNILDVTLFNQRPLLLHTVSDNENTFFGGYKSSGDIDATISLGRAADTGTGPDWPPYPTGYRIDTLALGGKAYRILLPATGGVERIGAFYVDAEKGTVLNRIITVTMAHSAGVMPESFTKMATIGEFVTLAMQPVNQTTLLEWRFNGVVKPTWVGRTSVLIPGVTKADEGIYECYVTGDREQGRQAIMRLIVRDCPPSQWDPPLCDQECPLCYNGGVCDAQFGLCVCPPGFGGTNCEAVYGRNRWGNDGQVACRGSADRHSPNCKGRFFCRPDPYGCSCIAGYKGLDCITDCDSGTYGAGCTQQCHCEGNSCLLDSGECPQGVGCMAGWKGVNCQVSDPCPAGYYGSLCTKRCRCNNNVPCDQQNGYCTNGCQTGYIGPECVDDGAPKFVGFTSQEQVNSGHITVLICTVTGNPIPTRYEVSVTDSSGAEVPLNETEKHSRLYTRDVRFAVRVTESGANFSCSLALPDGSSMVLMYTVNVYTPPILTNAPTIPVQNITANSVLVRWTRWDSSMGGDGPVDRYVVKYRESSIDPSALYINYVEVQDSRESSTTVGGLNWDTDYDFVVIAARQGERGEGPPSSKASATTKCDVPPAPVGVSIPSATIQSFTVEWFPPDPPHGLITGYDIQYWQTANRDNTIDSLKGRNDIVRAKTSVGSGPWSEPPKYVVTEDGIPGPPNNPMFSYIEEAGVTLSWSKPWNPNGNIVFYHVDHKAIRKPYEKNFSPLSGYVNALIEVTSNVDRYFNTTLDNLEPSTLYEFLISARTSAGQGEAVVIQLFTKGASNMPRPPPPSILRSSHTTVTVSFSALSFKYLVSYKIGIDKKRRVSKRDIPEFGANSDAYITAQISKFDFDGTFTVGDGKNYSGYENQPLVKDQEYLIYVGASSGFLENEVVKWNEEPLQVTAAPISSGPYTGVIIGASLAVPAIISAVVIIVIFVIKRRSRRKESPNKEASARKDVEITNVNRFDNKAFKFVINDYEYEDIDLDEQEYEEVTASKWDITWKDLDLSGQILGKGNFGEVQLGRIWIKEKWIKAAVKTLKDGTPESERILFKEEFDTMTKIGYHPNIVNVLGLCDHGGTLYVVLEYVPHGNLRTFLRTSRKNAKRMGNTVSQLNSDQLLNFGIGVAKAMKHLSNCGIIHRDLAARNVLVGKGLMPKVADFGMSRGEDVYVQKSSQRVPTRWLAIESLTKKSYSTKSDVWSFGILLWEISTLGGTPYSGMETKSLAYRLTDGYRMPKPDNCDDEMYELMLLCWKEDPEDRPSFKDICDTLSGMSSQEKIYMSTHYYQNFKYADIITDKDDN